MPLNERATQTLTLWAERFPERKPEHYVFASERYGIGGNTRDVIAYDVDATKAINSWKEAWESAKNAANVHCRFHDLRHTAVARMLEGGIALPVVASILGWSAATTVRMSKRYGHIGQVAQRQAVSLLEHHPTPKNENDEKTEKASAPLPAVVPLAPGSRTVN